MSDHNSWTPWPILFGNSGKQQKCSLLDFEDLSLVGPLLKEKIAKIVIFDHAAVNGGSMRLWVPWATLGSLFVKREYLYIIINMYKMSLCTINNLYVSFTYYCLQSKLYSIIASFPIPLVFFGVFLENMEIFF